MSSNNVKCPVDVSVQVKAVNDDLEEVLDTTPADMLLGGRVNPLSLSRLLWALSEILGTN